MAKTKISEFSATPGNNTDIDGINIAEGCAPSGINDAIRELMSQLKDFQAGTAGDSFNGPVGTTTAAAGAFTTLTASSTATLNTLASSGATLTGGSINNMAIGGTTAAAASVTTLTTSSTVTLSGGTANGVPYLNGSKVLTSGSALTFDGTTFGVSASGQLLKLTTSGNTASGGLAYLRFYDSVGARGYVGYVGTDTMQVTGNNVELQASTANIFTIGASEQARLTSTGLGIGTSSPGEKLQVGSGSASSNSVLLLNGASTSAYGAGIKLQKNSVNVGFIGSASWMEGGTSDDLAFSANSGATIGMRLNSSGNLGLGVTPSAWGVYKAADINTRGLGLAGGDQSYAITCNAYYDGSTWRYKGTSSYRVTRLDSFDGAYVFYTAPSGTAGNAISFTQAMTLDASGNLAIGLTSASARLHLGGSANNEIRVDTTASGYLQIGQFSNGAFIGTSSTDATAGILRLGTGGTERARIDSSGNLLVGKTSTATSAEGALIGKDAGGCYLTLGYTGTGTVNSVAFFRGTSGSLTQVGSISTTGSATAYNTSSDYRLKENIQPMTGALAKVQTLKPCTYRWKADGSDGEGFIAHELAEVVPQCVTGEKDAVDAEGKPVYQGIDTSFLVATLTAAIQEQQAIINDLRARVAQLESN